jgi:tetratricopeptide (TPR) repeat protein
MKRILLSLMFTAGIYALAAGQNRKIEDAKISLGQNDLETAMHDIEEAAKNATTANTAKMWAVRGTVYLRIATEEPFKHLDPEAPVKGLESYLNCIRLDRAEAKRKFKSVEEEYIQAVIPAFNYGLEKNQKANALLDEGKTEEGKAMMQQCIKAWDLVLQSYEFDANRKLTTTYSLSETNLWQYMADAHASLGNAEKAQEIFKKIQSEPKPTTYSFIRSSLMYLQATDTAAALSVIEKGRTAFPDNKDLTNLELMIYQNQGKIEELTDKISEALKNTPDDINLLFTRGNLYDNRGRTAVEAFKNELEKWYKAKERLKRTSNAQEKAKLKAEVDQAEADMNKKVTEHEYLDSLAVADYKRAYELNSEYFDAVFNLGAIYFNTAVPLIEKANYLTVDNTYQKKYDELEKKWIAKAEESIKWFLLAEELKPEDETVLYGLQQAYARIGNQEKAMEYKRKREGE